MIAEKQARLRRDLDEAERREELIQALVRVRGWREDKARKLVELGLKEHWSLREIWDKATDIPVAERQARGRRGRAPRQLDRP